MLYIFISYIYNQIANLKLNQGKERIILNILFLNPKIKVLSNESYYLNFSQIYTNSKENETINMSYFNRVLDFLKNLDMNENNLLQGKSPFDHIYMENYDSSSLRKYYLDFCIDIDKCTNYPFLIVTKNNQEIIYEGSLVSYFDIQNLETQKIKGSEQKVRNQTKHPFKTDIIPSDYSSIKKILSDEFPKKIISNEINFPIDYIIESYIFVTEYTVELDNIIILKWEPYSGDLSIEGA